MLTIIPILVLGWMLYAQAPSETRIDTFDKNGNRQGYIKVDPNTNRFDQFNKDGSRAGYGTIDSHGRVDLYNNDSTRKGYGTINGNGAVRK